MADEHFATKAIHEGQEPEQWRSMAVIPPISMATTFKQSSPGQHAGYEYGRSGNPTRDCLEKSLASLENGKHGLCFASGLAAQDCVSRLLQSGDHIVCMDDVYGGTNRYFSKILGKFGVDIDLVDMTVLSLVEKSVSKKTKLVWIETPSNPTMKVVDIAAVVEIVKRKSDAYVAVDNTFITPYFQRPLDLGADIVHHSVTKYINGHSDVIMGALVVKCDELNDKLRFLQNAIGAVPSPFDCFLVNRSIKTLHIRMREHMKNGLAVAQFLEKHPFVDSVVHPGLPSHPQYEVARKQSSGHSGMVTFYIKGGMKGSRAFLENLKLFTLAESLGGIESLAEHPAIMTHSSVPPEQRKTLGISDTLVRLSVGIEDLKDIIEDLEQALRAAQAAV